MNRVIFHKSFYSFWFSQKKWFTLQQFMNPLK